MQKGRGNGATSASNCWPPAKSRVQALRLQPYTYTSQHANTGLFSGLSGLIPSCYIHMA